MLEIIKLGTKADLLSQKLGVQFPPSQEMMQSTFGQGGFRCFPVETKADQQQAKQLCSY